MVSEGAEEVLLALAALLVEDILVLLEEIVGVSEASPEVPAPAAAAANRCFIIALATPNHTANHGPDDSQ